mmetsp:Transcript_105642/g.268348  ORF Transcript_105642/g.268348 Transcript_105642/m.268348 type:complete len:434 (-) Transcript_105642:631-1932(-)
MSHLTDQAGQGDDVSVGRLCAVHRRVKLLGRSLDAEHSEQRPRQGGIQPHIVVLDQVESFQACVTDLHESFLPDVASACLEGLRQAHLEAVGIPAAGRVWALLVEDIRGPVEVRVNDGDGQRPKHLDLFSRKRDRQAGIQDNKLKGRHLRRATSEGGRQPLPEGRQQATTDGSRGSVLPTGATQVRGGRGGLARSQQQHDVAGVQVAVYELVAEDHPHICRHSLPGDLTAEVRGDAQSLPQRLRTRRHSRGRAGDGGSRGRGASDLSRRGGFENIRQLLAGFPSEHQCLRRHEERRWEADSLPAAVEVRTEAAQVRGLFVEVRLHLYVLAELFGGLPNAEYSERLHPVGELAEAEQPREVRLEQRAHAGPQALHGDVRAIFELCKKDLRDAPRGVRLGFDRLDLDLVIAEGIGHLARGQPFRPPRRDLILKAA